MIGQSASWVPVDSYGWVFDLVVALPFVAACILVGLMIRSGIRHADAQYEAECERRDREFFDRHREQQFRLSLRQQASEDKRLNGSLFDLL